MIINFLQTRDPPILPSLQARPHKKRITPEGLVVSFDDDMTSLAGFGRKNKQSLGDLFFQFFRYYGYELDYETAVISIREGKVITKESKGWHLLQNNRLCVEEAFSTSRNLGNTADDTSFKGVHMELRRAFRAISDANFDECCTQYEYPAEEERFWERPTPQPRPIITAVPPHAARGGGRGSGRGGRGAGQFGRGFGRRVSNGLRHPSYPAPSDVSLQQQHAQFLLHDHLYQQIQFLQAQEQELRLQLQNQSYLTGRPSMFVRQPVVQFPVPHHESTPNGDESSRTTRSGSGASQGSQQQQHTPNTTPRQQIHYAPSYFPIAIPGVQGSSTNPPSPSPSAATVTDSRRNHRRSSTANGSPGGSLRAHSQPARPLHSQPIQGFVPLYTTIPQPVDNQQGSKQRHTPGSPEGSQGDNEQQQQQQQQGFMANGMPNGSRPTYVDVSRTPEYVGYYVSPSPQLQAYQQSPVLATPLSAPGGLALQNGFYPVLGQPQDYRSAVLAPSETWVQSSDGNNNSNNNNNNNSPYAKTGLPQRSQSVRQGQSGVRGPLIVDGSVPPSDQRGQTNGDTHDQYGAVNQYTSGSDDHNTSASGSDTFSQDLQDSSSVEGDRPFLIGRQPMGPQRPHNQSEAKANGHVDRSGTLAARLQKLHLSNTERSAESTPKAGTGQDKVKAIDASHEGGADKNASRPRHNTVASEKSAASTTGGTSWSAKARGPSPNGKRRANGVESEKSNNTTHQQKTKSRGRHENPDPPTSERQRSPRKTNGVSNSTNGAHGSSNGGWQTTKKKHKKNSKAHSDARPAGHNAVEPLPADQAMRKGG